MSFEEQFPSLKKHLAKFETGHSYVLTFDGVFVETEYIEKHCLDKAKVKEVILESINDKDKAEYILKEMGL